MSDPDLDRLVQWLNQSGRAVTGTFGSEASNQLVVPSLPPGQLAYEPNIPVLGAVSLERHESGLLVPQQQRASAGQFFGAFANANDVLGHPVAVSDLIDELRETSFEDLIGRLLTISALLEDKGRDQDALSRQLAQACCTPEVFVRLRPLLDSEQRVFTSRQVVSTLTRLAMGYCPESDDPVPNERIGGLLLSMGDSVGGRSGADDPEWPLDLARYGNFYSRDRDASLWGRFQRLWRETIPGLTEHPAYVDPGEAITRHTGIEYDDFIALGVGLSAVFSTKLPNNPPLWVGRDIQGTTLDDATIRAYVDIISADRAWFAEDVDPDDDSLCWDFTRFRQCPLLLHNNRLIPLSLQMLTERVTDGLYFFVVDALDAIAPERTGDWRTFFGAVWEAYVRALIHEAVGDGGRVIPEASMDEAWPENKKCDNVIEYPARMLLVESVAKTLTVATVATGGIADLEEDLRLAIVVKARQLASTVELLRTRSTDLEAVLGRLLQVGDETRFTPTIVLPGPLPRIPSLTAHVEDLLRADGACAPLFLPGVDSVTFMAAGDIELLMGTATDTGRLSVDLLDAWQASDLAELDFRTWASRDVPVGARLPQWLVDGGRAGLMWAARHLFRPDEMDAAQERSN